MTGARPLYRRFMRRHAGSAPTGDNIGMEIQLNGQNRPLAPAITITALLLAEGLAERRVAVEVNGEIIPRGQHATHVLRAGDRVEIVHALGGG
jgi:sulfur carrier protein